MATFIVKTHESVAGTYKVEAETEEEARCFFSDNLPHIDWDHVEQQDYVAFGLEVQSVERAERLLGPRLWGLDAEALRMIPDPEVDERTGH